MYCSLSKALYSIGAVTHNITEDCIVKENNSLFKRCHAQYSEYDVTGGIRKTRRYGGGWRGGPLRVRGRRASVKIT